MISAVRFRRSDLDPFNTISFQHRHISGPVRIETDIKNEANDVTTTLTVLNFQHSEIKNEHPDKTPEYPDNTPEYPDDTPDYSDDTPDYPDETPDHSEIKNEYLDKIPENPNDTPDYPDETGDVFKIKEEDSESEEDLDEIFQFVDDYQKANPIQSQTANFPS